MRTWRAAFLSLAIAGVAAAQAAPPPPDADGRAAVGELLKDVSKERLRRYIQELEDFGTRYVGADNQRSVARHVKSVFRQMGLDPVSHRFTFPRDVIWANGDWSQLRGLPLENIIVTIPGRNRSLPPVVLSAHYDSINWNNSPNSIARPNVAAPGADDAGSGMAVLFETARLLKDARLERDVRLIAFTSEEQGLVGSQEYLKKLERSGEKILALINYDMVGFGRKLELEVPRESRWLLDRMREVQRAHNLWFDVRYHVGPSRADYDRQGALRGSDHTHFIRTGYDAVAGFEARLDPDIWRNGYNPNYHWSTDKVTTLNFDLIADVAKLTVATIGDLSGPAPRVVQNNRTTRGQTVVKSEAAAAGKFAAAYLLKEGVKSLAAGDEEAVMAAARGMATWEFWGSLGAFTAASRGVEMGLDTRKLGGRLPGKARKLARGMLPIAAGMAAVEALAGPVSAERVAIGTVAYAGSGAGVQGATSLFDRKLSAILAAAGARGKIASGAYQVAKLGAVLAGGEQLEGVVHGLLGR